MVNKCHIIQHGVDGFGHQLHGLFSSLILHNVGSYYFDGISYCKRKFSFAHITAEEGILMKDYLKEAIINFCRDNKQYSIKYNRFTFVTEIYNIPKNYDSKILYGIDNAYYFDRINLTDGERKLHEKNIEKYRKYFINNKYLPANRLNKKNIVVHIRLGDALHDARREELLDFNNKIVKLMDKLIIDYPDHTIYVHSNGIPDFLKNFNYIFYGDSTPLIRVLGDLINAKILVCGSSGLSKICTFLGNQELIIIPDDTKHSMPQKSIKMSDYINSY